MMRAICFFTLLIPLSVWAQQRNIALLCSPQPDSIMLRWAPTDRETWRLGNRYGYVVERYTMMRNNQLLDDMPLSLLTAEPLKFQPMEKWEPYSEDKYVSIAAECLFNRDSLVTGGNPHLIVRRFKEEQNRFSFALYAADRSLTTARLSGLYLSDKTAQKNEKYHYRVYIAVPVAEEGGAISDTAFAFTGISEYRPLPAPLGLKARWKDKQVELSWDILYLSHIYNSYIVERSTDGKQFSPLGENASVQLADEGITARSAYKTDTLDNNTMVYFYRIRGINAFGETGPPCEAISGKGNIPITNAPVVFGNEVIDNEKVQLEWLYPETMNEYISGFKIYRSPKPAGIKDLLYQVDNPVARAFTDEHPNLTNYYTVSVFNNEKEVLSPMQTYAELIDSIPPAPPVGLAGSIDSTGHVFLRWAFNTEPDVEGYRVYKANRPDFEFMLAHPSIIKDSAFVDSVNIKTLDKNAYYKIRAIDLRQNQSEFSDLLTLNKPDVIPPVSPVIKGIEVQGKSLSVSWVNSTSGDVAQHHVYRQAPGDTAYLPLTVIAYKKETYTSFADLSVQAGKIYRYRIVAEDQSGLFSAPSKPIQGKATGGEPERITLKVRKITGKAALSWTITADKKVKRVLVYRSIGDAPLLLLGNSTEDTFIDDVVHPEKPYTYRIQAVYDDESMSLLSNAVIIK